MHSFSFIDHAALFDDVVAVARSAHAATAGWRAICVRAQRTVGKKVTQPLSVFDLDEELPALRNRVCALARKAPSDIDTLIFGLFDGVDDDGRGIYTGFHLAGSAGIDDEDGESMQGPSWLPPHRFLESRALDAILRASVDARGEVKRAVSRALRFGVAALLARFASEELPYRVVVAFDEDEGEGVEISEGGRHGRANVDAVLLEGLRRPERAVTLAAFEGQVRPMRPYL